MVSFESDYIAGAHPKILERLIETNMEPLSGYGADAWSESAKEKIRTACGDASPAVEFVVGGTQANLTVISSMLKDYEGVIAAPTAHVSTHEAGAIEYSGHKVIEVPGADGKIIPESLLQYLLGFYADENHEHMVFPGMVYISWPTELGTLYSKKELAEIAAICREYKMPLYMDGARMGYGLMSEGCDLTLPEIASLCDVFTIGGTKVGALCGEALVFKKEMLPEHFMTSVKKRGALLAKGRLLGIQFDTLFTDGLYFEISAHAIKMAKKLKALFYRYGYQLYPDSPTNQQFIILDNDTLQQLKRKVAFSFWDKYDETHTIVRFAVSWSTTDEDLNVLEEALAACAL